MQQLTPDVASALRGSSFSDIYIRLQPLDRALYVKVNKVLELFGAKWDRRSQSHILSNPQMMDELKTAIENGAVERKKTIQQEIGFFPTPTALADRMVNLMPSLLGRRILEPSAGTGSIVRSALKRFPGEVVCVESWHPNAEFLRENFVGTYEDIIIHEADFLTLSPENLGTFDVILMNPPFQKKNDVRHVLHALEFLKPDGFIAAVLSASVLFNTDSLSQHFREVVKQRGWLIEKLPDGTFKESGTSVSTVLLTVPW